ncbi:hypothetical protein NDU88_003190 [Pleurodeles waltl]|uniref:Uncharacterized protein n=1 Tax=Pleurodeles waltl TaxID=8319 RepID=A0AAV7TPU4_PLEWA|nr:hypothetical protein NDU88_003190 [Pleurodeles waltl]
MHALVHLCAYDWGSLAPTSLPLLPHTLVLLEVLYEMRVPVNGAHLTLVAAAGSPIQCRLALLPKMQQPSVPCSCDCDTGEAVYTLPSWLPPLGQSHIAGDVAVLCSETFGRSGDEQEVLKYCMGAPWIAGPHFQSRVAQL